MTCCVSDRSSHSSSTKLVQHPDRTPERHMGKIPSLWLSLRLCRNLSASIRTILPICYSFRCGCATDTRRLTADFVLRRSPKSVF